MKGSIIPARWMAVHMGGDKSFCHVEEIINSSASTRDNIMLRSLWLSILNAAHVRKPPSTSVITLFTVNKELH